jgi:hypothetical protein
MRLLFTISCLLLSWVTYAQRYAVASGNWNDAIWASTPAGIAGSASVPTSADNVFTNGFSVTVDSDVSCNNLNITRSVSSSLVISDFSFATVTINGQLSGVGVASPFSPGPPTVSDALIMGEFETLLFSGAGQKINAWLYVNPLTNVIFNPGTSNTQTLNTGFSVSNNGIVTLLSGTLTVASSTSREIRGCSTCGFVIDANSTLNLSSAINGGSSSTSIGSVTISGNAILTSAAYINSSDFSTTGTGSVTTSFNGINQTEGWWFQSNRPSGGTINPASTISFNASANQNIYARNYGNLFLDGSGNKTITGTGTLNISGTFTVNSSSVTLNTNSASAINIGGGLVNEGTWAPSDLVTFNGSGSQQISGSSAVNFTGGLTVNKSAGTLSFANDISISNGLTITTGTFDMGSRTVTLSSGNISNLGTITPGTSTLIIDGTTSVTSPSFAVNNLTINGTFTAPTTLNISGNLTNSGTFNANSGTLVFNGTANQSITATLPLDVNNISVTNAVSSNGISINSGTVNLNGTLTLVNGGSKFDADGSGSGFLVVKSTSLNDGGRIATLPTPNNFSGDVTIERFIDASTTYRYLSMPLDIGGVGGNAGLWQDDFPVTGDFSNSSPNGVDEVEDNTATSIYSWDAAIQDWHEEGTGAATGSTTLNKNKGYSVYAFLLGNFTIDLRGNIAKNNVVIPLSATNPGWNLIGNPYPSAIDWDNIAKPAGLNDQMSIRTTSGSFASYAGGIAANPPFVGWTGEVAIGQAFWVNSSSATSMTIMEDDKTGNQYEFLRTSDPDNYIRVALSLINQSDGSVKQRDEAIIRFAETATETFDGEFDAIKRKNGEYSSGLGRQDFLNLSSYVSNANNDLSINAVPLFSCTKTIPLKIEDVASGNYTLSFGDIEKMGDGYDITLVDNYTSTEEPVSAQSAYAFAVNQSIPSTFGSSRFVIRFTTREISTVAPVFNDLKQCSDQYVKIELENSQGGLKYQLFKGAELIGQPVLSGTGATKFFVPRSQLSEGANTLILKASTNDACYSQTFDNAFTYYYDGTPLISSVTGGEHCGKGPIELSASAQTEGTYKWYESVTSTSPIFTSENGVYSTVELEQTKTFYVGLTNDSGCESLRQAVDAKITHVNGEISSVTNGQRCGEGSVTLTADSGLSGTYKWFASLESSEPLYTSENGTFVTPLLAGPKTYYVSQINSVGCETAKKEVVAEVTILEKPSISIVGNALTSSSSTDNQWYRNGVLLEGETGSDLQAKESGTYQVKLNAAGCEIFSDEMTFSVTGSEENNNSFFRIYPNPVEQTMIIELDESIASKLTELSIYDSKGVQVMTLNKNEISQKERIEIDFSNKRPGIYVMNAIVGNKATVVRIVKK